MENLESISLYAGMAALGFGFILSLFLIITKKDFIKAVRRGNDERTNDRAFTPGSRIWLTIAALAFIFISFSIVTRIIESGHGPFSNMYEFSVAFSWG